MTLKRAPLSHKRTQENVSAQQRGFRMRGTPQPSMESVPAPSVSRGKQGARTLTRSRLTHLQLLVLLPEAHEPVWLPVPLSAAPLEHQRVRQLQFLC